MEITLKQLKGLGACPEGLEWFRNQKAREAKTVLRKLVTQNHTE